MRAIASVIAPELGVLATISLSDAKIAPESAVIGASSTLVGAIFDVYGTLDSNAVASSPNLKFLGRWTVPDGEPVSRPQLDVRGWPILGFIQRSDVSISEGFLLYVSGELAPMPSEGSLSVNAPAVGDFTESALSCEGSPTRISLSADATSGDTVEVYSCEYDGGNDAGGCAFLGTLTGGAGDSLTVECSAVQIKTIGKATSELKVLSAPIAVGAGTGVPAHVAPNASTLVQRDASSRAFAAQWRGSGGVVEVTDANVGLTADQAISLVAAAGSVSVSATKGLVVPVRTTAQRDAIVAPAEGTLIYNSTTHKLNVRTAAAWEVVTSA